MSAMDYRRSPMSSFLLRSNLSDVSDFGQNESVFWVMADVDGFAAWKCKPDTLTDLQSGIVPDFLQFDGETDGTTLKYLSNRFKADGISIDDTVVVTEILEDLSAWVENGVHVLDLSKQSLKNFGLPFSVLGIYSESAHLEIVRLSAESSKLDQPEVHIVGSEVKLLDATLGEVVGTGLVQKVFELILPYAKASVDQFIDGNNTLLLPIATGRNGRFIQGLAPLYDARLSGYGIRIIEVDRDFTEVESALYLARDAIPKFHLPKSVQIELIIAIFGDQLRPNTGRNRGNANKSVSTGLNMTKVVSQTLGMSGPTASHNVAEARKRLGINQAKTPKVPEIDLNAKSDELVKILTDGLNKVATDISAIEDVGLRQRLLSNFLLRTSKCRQSKYLQALIKKKGEST